MCRRGKAARLAAESEALFACNLSSRYRRPTLAAKDGLGGSTEAGPGRLRNLHRSRQPETFRPCAPAAPFSAGAGPSALTREVQRAHLPHSSLLHRSAISSSKMRILRNGSLSQNPFVPQLVSWSGDWIAPVGPYCSLSASILVT